MVSHQRVTHASEGSVMTNSDTLADCRSIYCKMVLSIREALVLDLATEIHKARSPDVVVSWEAQKEAYDFLVNNGLGGALDRLRVISTWNKDNRL